MPLPPSAALKDSLEASGALEGLRAHIRGEVYTALHDETLEPPRMSNENMLINELIREYLAFNQYATVPHRATHRATLHATLHTRLCFSAACPSSVSSFFTLGFSLSRPHCHGCPG